MKENQQVAESSAMAPQDTQSMPESPKRKTTTRVVIISIWSLLLVALLGVTGYLAYQNALLRKQLAQEASSLPSSITIPTPTKGLESRITPTVVQEVTKKLKEILTDWTTYKDPKLGFSFDNPNQYVLDLGLEYPDPSWSKIRLYEPSVYKWIEKDGHMGSAPGMYISVYEETKETPLMDRAKEIVHNTYFGMDNGTYELRRMEGVDTIKHSDGEKVSYYLYVDHHLLIFANLGAPPKDFEKLISTVYLP